MKYQDQPANPRAYLPHEFEPRGTIPAPALCAACGLSGFDPIHGPTEWTIETLTRDFEVLGFQAPYVVVVRKADGQKGSLMFDHSPRRYYGFEAYCS